MRLERVGPAEVKAYAAVEASIYVNSEIHLENSALEELQTFSEINGIQHLSLTPDFHKATGTPVGTVALIDRVYPRVTGNDIGCGMRLDKLEIDDVTITADLINDLRHLFFQGGRQVSVDSRHDILAFGLEADIGGKSASFIPRINKAHQGGSLGDGSVGSLFDQYVGNQNKIDNFLGNISGGNHFVEIQQVDEIVDRRLAYLHGLTLGSYYVMCHSGSQDLGHVVAQYYIGKAREHWQGKQPENGYLSLPDDLGLKYIRDSYNAANFASVNRAVLASMVAQTLKCELRSIYDAPHNLVWLSDASFLHRKGSCPASLDEPVLVPGSMGTRSLFAVGQGFSGTLNSAPHGAGRTLNRNSARHQSVEKLNVVTPVDPTKVRADVARELAKDLAEEAPSAYKDIKQVAASVETAGIATIVAWLKPILTLKG